MTAFSNMFHKRSGEIEVKRGPDGKIRDGRRGSGALFRGVREWMDGCRRVNKKRDEQE